MNLRQLVLRLALLVGLSIVALSQSPMKPPKIWDDAALADWATPVAGLNVRPSHYSSAEYYSVAADNLRTYPVYHPDNEPPGYWEELRKKKPEPLVDIAKIKTKDDWIAAGQRAFREMDGACTHGRSRDNRAVARSTLIRARGEVA